MATAEKTPPTQPVDDPFAWDPDPEVLVSRRARVLYFPEDLARRDPTGDDVKAWTGREATYGSRRDKQLAVNAGVTFLGCYTSSWAYLHTQPGHAPSGPPRSDQMVLVEPFCEARSVLAHPASGYMDRETQRMRPDKVRNFLLRVLAYTRKHSLPELWETPDGFDAPELMLVRLSDVLTQKTDAGQQARATVEAAIPHLRRNKHEVITPLGALHDYAMRHRAGASIVNACRAWAARKKVG